MSHELLNTMEIDAIGEIINISLGASATAISTMLSRKVNITIPKVREVSFEEFQFKKLEPAIGVEITYTQGLSGNNVMLIKRTDIKKIVAMLMGNEPEDEDDGEELNELYLSAICEVMNQMMGASATALAEFIGEPVNITTPTSFEIENTEAFKQKYFSPEEHFAAIEFDLTIEGAMTSEFINLMPISLAKSLVSKMMGDMDDYQEPEVVAAPAAPASPVIEQIVSPPAPPAPPVQEPVQQAPIQQAPIQQAPPRPVENKVINVQPIVDDSFAGLAPPGMENQENMKLLMDVPLEISVEIGRTKKLIKEIIELSQGSLIVLDKLAGDQVEIYANDRCIAKGDVVVVNDNFGVRITEIVKQNK